MPTILLRPKTTAVEPDTFFFISYSWHIFFILFYIIALYKTLTPVFSMSLMQPLGVQGRKPDFKSPGNVFSSSSEKKYLSSNFFIASTSKSVCHIFILCFWPVATRPWFVVQRPSTSWKGFLFVERNRNRKSDGNQNRNQLITLLGDTASVTRWESIWQ